MKLFIVRAEVRGCPESSRCCTESILGGVYPTDQLAEARCEYLREEGWDTVWYDTVEMRFHGVDCEQLGYRLGRRLEYSLWDGEVMNKPMVNKMKTKLILIRGLPGSGKTTMANAMVSENYKMIHVETDQYFTDSNGTYRFDASELTDAHEWCQHVTRNYLIDNTSVVVSNTFSRRWEMKPYLDMARELGVQVEILEATGEYTSVHDVPKHTIEAMKQRWEAV